jgi:two-component system cell cycle response regulator
MGICSECGTGLPPGSRYCLQCGAPVEVSEQETPGPLSAYTDPLTGLHNRRYMMHQLERHLEIYKRYRHPFALLRIDSDALQWVNDTFGPAAAQSALQHLATLIKMNLRGADIPCRSGGGQFVVILPETDGQAVQVVGRRISDTVKKTGFKIGHALAILEVNYGTSSCPEDGTEPRALLETAGKRREQ